MSSRQLRKLQQQRELERQAKLQELEEDESDDEPVVPIKSKASLFANLAAWEDEDQDEDEEQEKAEVEVPEEELSNISTTRAKKPKKSKKRKRVKNKSKEPPTEENNGEDDIDAALRELDVNEPAIGMIDYGKPRVDPDHEKVCQLLGVNTQHLKVANEMRNLFGRTAVDNHDDAGGPVGRGGRRRQRGQNQPVDLETALKGNHLPGKGLPELTLRRNAFIQGKEDWPRATTGGLTMEIIDDKAEDGTVEFTFVHETAYQAVMPQFYEFVEMGVPENLIGLLIRNPYHISLLIQVSKIAKDQGDSALSSDLLERALFSFSRASLSQFNTKLAQGKARLDFARPENRELWLAGAQYIKSLIMKGTFRTALEWAKLLLSLDPERDPYCMRLMIHHLALRAHEIDWLLDFSESAVSGHGFQEEWQGGIDESKAASHTIPSFAFAALQLRDSAKQRELLTKSMTTVPWLFVRLFKELSLDAPPSIWGITPRTDAEALFTKIYISQTKDLWNIPEAIALLMEIAHTIKKINVDAIPVVENKEMTLDVVRFVYLDNSPELMAMTPSHLLHREDNSDSDPLPPELNIVSYYTGQRLRTLQSGPELGGDFLDPIAALLRLLPGFGEEAGVDATTDATSQRIRRENEDEEEGEQGEGMEEEEREVVGAVTRLLRRLVRQGQNDDGWVNERDGESRTTNDEMPDLIP